MFRANKTNYAKPLVRMTVRRTLLRPRVLAAQSYALTAPSKTQEEGMRMLQSLSGWCTAAAVAMFLIAALPTESQGQTGATVVSAQSRTPSKTPDASEATAPCSV